mmetsp:Transcript_36754/g.56457  ORF Transcript_36754/g.56457 Transcript_36754/m.56457 type:complete len:201 (+) Transcript_36754:93-695(+)|eukprot:CAMPEP_0118725074 /NCGR_PEP_ID=MMETSP0800-20121206/32941_1 /TAXON_ID=210618 ORGANISM="Striatella unipunctata, Strain CCMP2910" /NCGR_SAMPLE_ID=MMETSP0800 /ASSEMBLY_ACC=CAM_ASM_000638 /LENGTH=200 /DNA_ID=CAMNT_0006633739 /DNA_START=15 /DNA_END=617 /DNA_ORIENTATION=-
MDSVLGVTYKGGVILAADQGNARSILMYQKNLDKITSLSGHTALACSGPHADVVNFSEFIAKNIKLYEFSKDGTVLSTHAQANYCRNELAKALRKGPYQVNNLLGGFDKKAGGSLYFLDYLASLQKVNFGAQGYCGHFCLSIMDRDWKEGLTKDEAVEIIKHCINEIHTRFLIAQPNFIIKNIDANGVEIVSFGEDPASA